LGVTINDPSLATVIATAQHEADGSSIPWATRSKGLTYVGENPFVYATEADRYIAFADLMFDLLAPTTPERHRAMVRLEDVSPMSNPKRLRELADVLSSRNIPYSLAVFPIYVDPNGLGKGKELRVTLADRPKVVAALKYMASHGATIIQHGDTHQFGTTPNPYNGRSAADFEFFTAHLDDQDAVIKDGPVPGDSAAWAGARMDEATKMMKAAGLAKPTIWEFPHYAASYVDYAAAGKRYAARYEREILFSGGLTGQKVDTSTFIGQFFPYEVVDVYGAKVIPENLGNVALASYNQHSAVMPPEVIRRAAANLVVRDGFASFFYHAFYSPVLLAQLLDGIKDLGYTFVSPADVLNSFPAVAGGTRKS
ncbi:MAG: polysaccharide deacetylase family protein, partial [Candidatus Nanopelagicales bacterium]